MSRRMVGLVLLLCVSEASGLVFGQWFYTLFLKTVPPLALSEFNQGAAHAAYLIYGAAVGLAVFLVSLASALLSPLFRTPTVNGPAGSDGE